MSSKFRNTSIRVILTAAIGLLPVCAAHAEVLTYTFTGVGSGTISGNSSSTFTDAGFTLKFTEDPGTVSDAGGGYFRLNDISGTFTEGAYTATLTGVTIVVNGDGAFENVNFYNADFGNGLGLQNDPALLGYALATPVSTGTATGANLETTLNNVGGGFSSAGGNTVEFTGLDSLAFSATAPTSPVPEPSALILLATGLFGGGAFRLRRKP